MSDRIEDVRTISVIRLPDGNNIIPTVNRNEQKSCLGFRWILVILGFFLYFDMFYHRNSFPVALVAMVNITTSQNQRDISTSSSSCSPKNSSNSPPQTSNENGEFDWTSSEQGIILAAFFWGVLLAKLFVSRLGEVIGQRGTIASGVAISGILVLLSPLAARVHPYLLAGNRFLIGACFGPLSSSLHSLISAWAPRKDLSFMVTIVYAGSSFGGMVGLLVSGWLQETFGWQMTFWLGSAVNGLFLPFWIILVRNSPKEHPWLSSYERELLRENDYITTQKSVPWKKIMKSPYLHICILGHFARCYIDVILTTEGPSFFTQQMGLQLSTASYVCGAHYFISIVFVLVFGKISDSIIEKKLVSKLTARKLFHFMGTGISALLLLTVTLVGCNVPAVITLWVLMGASVDGTACSYFVSPIDVAPNYTATFVGLMAIGNIGAAVAPTITTTLLKFDNGWNEAFYVTFVINVLSCVIYIVFMTAQPQSWNFEEDDNDNNNNNEQTKL